MSAILGKILCACGLHRWRPECEYPVKYFASWELHRCSRPGCRRRCDVFHLKSGLTICQLRNWEEE